MPRKAAPFQGMQYKMPDMTDLTRVARERKPSQTPRSVGGSGHRAGHGAQQAVTSGMVPAANFPMIKQGGPNDGG